MNKRIAYRDDKDVSPSAMRALFKRNQWNDYLSLKEVEWYLNHALYVASAWQGRQAIGVATLCGDGKISIELDTLLVDKQYQHNGIGRTLVGMVVKKAKDLRPYHFKVEVYEESTEKLYAGFGFEKNESTWLLFHGDIHVRLRKKLGVRQRIFTDAFFGFRYLFNTNNTKTSTEPFPVIGSLYMKALRKGIP